MPHIQETPRQLYHDVNTATLQSDADDCLLNYGTAFNREIITHASDVFIYTSTGRRIVDMTSGQMSCLIGHGHPEVVKTITEHAMGLDHLFSGMISPPVIQLAKKLTELLPEGLDKAMFLSTGGESNEAAIKLAKVFTGKWEIVGLGASWHGMTGAAVAAQYHSGRKGYGPMVRVTLDARSSTAYTFLDSWQSRLASPKCVPVYFPPFRRIVRLGNRAGLWVGDG
jgi:4-aminobutyrate aminotransferase-like enzyme